MYIYFLLISAAFIDAYFNSTLGMLDLTNRSEDSYALQQYFNGSDYSILKKFVILTLPSPIVPITLAI